jgi:glutamate-5-semialdehyde dehydrogenase
MLTEIAQKTRLAAQHLASLPSNLKNQAIELVAQSLATHADKLN